MFEVADSAFSTVSMWSSDAYYYDPQDFDEDYTQKNQVELPHEYHPVWKMPDPWHRSSQCKGDFILVAEFSELEGPKPLITIPKEISGKFDLNDFSVRIMTVDCQSHPSERFKIHEDRSIVMSEAKYGIYAYVHHFTLYDCKARGFVRPFCMTYVTSDKSKLDYFYEDIEREFESVCWKMRQGNLMVFVKDMTYHLTDLQYTKEKFLEKQHQLEQDAEFENQTTGLPNFLDMLTPEDEIVLQSLTLDSLHSAIKEVKHILQTVNTLIASLDLTAEESEEYGVLVSNTNNFNGYQSRNMSSSVCSTPKPRFSPCVSNFVQYSSSLSESNFASHMDRAKTPTVRRSGSFTYLASQCDASEEGCSVYEPKLVRTTNKRRYDKTLRTLHELCLTSAKKGLNRLRYVQKYFAKDLATLKLERREAEVLDPNEGLLTTGKCIDMNFLPQECFGPMKHSQSDVFSDDTASYQSAESFLSCDDTSPTKVGRIVISNSLDDIDWHRRNSDSGMVNTTLTSSATGSVNSLGSSILPDYDVLTQSSVQSDSVSDLDISSGFDNISVKMGNVAGISENELMTASQPAEKEDFQSEEQQRCKMVINEPNGDSANCSCDEPFHVFSLPDQIYCLCKSTQGYGLLKLMQKYTFAPHLMFSLLCGRNVIIMGSKKREEDIKAAITAFTFFVPGYRRNSNDAQVYSETLSQRLLNQKLIGLVPNSTVTRDKLVPKELEPLCTVLDVDMKMLYGPCYHGGVLTEVYNKRKLHAADSTYLLHVHSLIQELSMKAYVFYHTFIVNVSSKLPVMYTNPAEAKLAKEKAEYHFLSNMKMSLHDCEIVKSLAELVQQQIEGNVKCTSHDPVSSEIPEPKLKNIPCQLFKL